MSTSRSSGATTRRSPTRPTSTPSVRHSVPASQREPHPRPVVAARLEPEPLVERTGTGRGHQADERAGAAELADAIEQRLGDACADAVVPPALEDDDVLQVEIDAAIANDPAHPDERAVDVACEHRRERCVQAGRYLCRVDRGPPDVGAERRVLLRRRRPGDDLHKVGHVRPGPYRRAVDERIETGRRGEAAAERHYVARGYRVVARNWRCGIGELDLVVMRGATLVFCEVKTRRVARFGGGLEAVDARKQHT